MNMNELETGYYKTKAHRKGTWIEAEIRAGGIMGLEPVMYIAGEEVAHEDALEEWVFMMEHKITEAEFNLIKAQREYDQAQDNRPPRCLIDLAPDYFGISQYDEPQRIAEVVAALPWGKDLDSTVTAAQILGELTKHLENSLEDDLRAYKDTIYAISAEYKPYIETLKAKRQELKEKIKEALEASGQRRIEEPTGLGRTMAIQEREALEISDFRAAVEGLAERPELQDEILKLLKKTWIKGTPPPKGSCVKKYYILS